MPRMKAALYLLMISTFCLTGCSIPDFMLPDYMIETDEELTATNINMCLHLCDIYYQEHRKEAPSFETVMAQAYNNMRESVSEQETHDRTTKLTKDAWGNDLIFSHSKEGDDLIMTLLSIGRDQKPGTKDDIQESVRIKDHYTERAEQDGGNKGYDLF